MGGIESKTLSDVYPHAPAYNIPLQLTICHILFKIVRMLSDILPMTFDDHEEKRFRSYDVVV